MKPTPLRRKPHPDNPYGTFAPRAKPMPRMSVKKQKAVSDLAPYRVWLSSCHRECDCGCGELAVDIHEIAAGSHRERSLQRPRTWLYLSRECHDRIQGIAFEEQLEILFGAIRRDLNWCLGRNAV